MATKFGVVSVWAEDVEQTAHFYRDVLGLPQLALHAARPHFQVNGIYFLILRGKPIAAQDSQPERFPLFAFSVDDLDQMVQQLEGHGVALPWGIEENDSERWVMFHDPAGNLIEIVQWRA